MVGPRRCCDPPSVGYRASPRCRQAPSACNRPRAVSLRRQGHGDHPGDLDGDGRRSRKRHGCAQRRCTWTHDCHVRIENRDWQSFESFRSHFVGTHAIEVKPIGVAEPGRLVARETDSMAREREGMSKFFKAALGGCAGLLMLLCQGSASAQSVDWPAFGPDRDYLRFKGFTNTVPDFVGPIDGSADLTVFTEGNHFPVLLPLMLETFPAWCRSSGACNVEAGKILIVTLPQPMIVDILLKGGVRFGNAVLPVDR